MKLYVLWSACNRVGSVASADHVSLPLFLQIRILDKRNRSLISENESLIAAHASAVEASSRAEQARASTQSRIQDLHDQLGGLKSAWEAELSARLSEQSAEVAALKQQLARKVDAGVILQKSFV